jgi:hypothetical protein
MAHCKDKFLVQTEVLQPGEEIGPETFKKAEVSAAASERGPAAGCLAGARHVLDARTWIAGGAPLQEVAPLLPAESAASQRLRQPPRAAGRLTC